ncbi:MAG: hypothetical protein ABIH92_03725 [Nanoarchaeota archaeon]
MKIIPTVFAKTKKEFNEDFKKILPISKNIQIDFMDGKFVKAKSIQLKNIPNLKKYNKNFEAHLMVLHPERHIKKLEQKGFKKIFFHFESTKSPEKIIEKIKPFKVAAGIAFNPKTPLSQILRIKDRADIILLMGHTPGIEGAPLNKKVLEKIKKLRKLDKKIKIQVDGAVNDKTILKLKRAGVNYVNIGSFISSSNKPRQTLKILREKIK